MKFFVGIAQPGDAQNFDCCCISINRLETRVKVVDCSEVLVDSGAFTTVSKHGGYPDSVEVYAARLHRLYTRGVLKIAAAVAQDYMCEPFILAKTGLTISDHQRLTIERYDALIVALHSLFGGSPPFHVMPVLQGFAPSDYVRHLEMYGDRLKPSMWVGVGSVCKRQGNPELVADVLLAIKEVRPDLRLHGFRLEDHGSAQPGSRRTTALGRQHGLELRRAKAGARREQLAGGGRIRSAGRERAGSILAAAPVSNFRQVNA